MKTLKDVLQDLLIFALAYVVFPVTIMISIVLIAILFLNGVYPLGIIVVAAFIAFMKLRRILIDYAVARSTVYREDGEKIKLATIMEEFNKYNKMIRNTMWVKSEGVEGEDRLCYISKDNKYAVSELSGLSSIDGGLTTSTMFSISPKFIVVIDDKMYYPSYRDCLKLNKMLKNERFKFTLNDIVPA